MGRRCPGGPPGRRRSIRRPSRSRGAPGRGPKRGPADWYTVTLQGTAEVRAVLDLLRNGVDGEIAEESFTNATGGQMPAGSLIFDADTAAALAAAGEAAGVFFERGVGAKPATTQLNEAPRVAILVNSGSPAEDDTSWSLRQIFGADVGFVSMVTGKGSLERASTDPSGELRRHLQHRPELPCRQVRHRAARLRRSSRGWRYIGTSVSSANFSFLNSAQPALIQGTLTQSSDTADGGIARWGNVGAAGPLTGGFSTTDNLYLPVDVTWFSSTPSGATVDGRYLSSVNTLFIAGLWRDRNPAAANAPMIVHGTTEAGSRYLGLATNPSPEVTLSESGRSSAKRHSGRTSQTTRRKRRRDRERPTPNRGFDVKQGSWACQVVPDRARNRAPQRSPTVSEPSQRRSCSRCRRLGPSQADNAGRCWPPASHPAESVDLTAVGQR